MILRNNSSSVLFTSFLWLVRSSRIIETSGALEENPSDFPDISCNLHKELIFSSYTGLPGTLLNGIRRSAAKTLYSHAY